VKIGFVTRHNKIDSAERDPAGFEMPADALERGGERRFVNVFQNADGIDAIELLGLQCAGVL
jgi:hypothetical protein